MSGTPSGPTLSVVVIPDGRPHSLGSCLWSILRQPVSIEVLLVDDGATRPAGVARRLAAVDERVRTLTAVPRNAVSAGLAAARGSFLGFVHSDHLIGGDSYARLVRQLQRSGSDLAIGGHETLPAKGARQPSSFREPPGTGVRLRDRPGLLDASLAGTVFRTSFLIAEAGLVEDAGSLSDRSLLARACSAAGAIDVLPDATCYRRAPQGSAPPTAASLADWLLEVQRTLEVLDLADQSSARTQFAERALAELPGRLEESAAPDSARQSSAPMRSILSAAPAGGLPRLPSRARWQAALIALGRAELAASLGDPQTASAAAFAVEEPLPASLTAVLGLGSESLQTAFHSRFADPGSPPAPAVPDGANPPEVSVVIPTHNVEDYVDDLLASVRAATGVRLEIIVVDDHSTDQTWSILQRHAEQDPRLRILRSPGRGGGQARNAGVAAATGEWLCFADGDDLVPADAYAAMLAAARRTDAEIVTGSYQKFGDGWVWDGGELFGYDVELDSVDVNRHPRLLTHRTCWNRLIRRDFWLAHRLEFPDVPRANDVVPVTKALLAASRISVVPVLSYRYRTRPDSMTAAQGSAASLVSYLSQEAAAAELIRHGAAPHAQDEYWSVILPHDCWRHLHSHLRSTAEPQSDAAVVTGLTRLLDLAPIAARQELTLLQKATCGLVSAGLMPEAALLATAANRVGRLSRPTALDPGQAAGVLAAVFRTGALSTTECRLLASALLLPVLDQSATPSLAVAQAAVELVRGLVQEGATTLAAPPGSRQERIARALQRGGPAQLLEVLGEETPAARATLDHRLRGSWLTGSAHPARGKTVWLVARRKIDGDEVELPIGPILSDAGRPGWRIPLRPAGFPRTGGWRLSLRWEDEWGSRNPPLTVGRPSRRGLLARASRFAPAADGSGLVLAPSLAARGRRAIGRLRARGRIKQ